MDFRSLNYLCMLQDTYEEYCDECMTNEQPPLSPQDWYRKVWQNME